MGYRERIVREIRIRKKRREVEARSTIAITMATAATTRS